MVSTMVNKTTLHDHIGEPMTWSVPEAGYKMFGAGRNKSYDLVREGLIPTIEVGGKLRVSIEAAKRRLEESRPNSRSRINTPNRPD